MDDVTSFLKQQTSRLTITVTVNPSVVWIGRQSVNTYLHIHINTTIIGPAAAAILLLLLWLLVIESATFVFQDNFGKGGPILTIPSLLHSAINCRERCDKTYQLLKSAAAAASTTTSSLLSSFCCFCLPSQRFWSYCRLGD